MRTEYAFWCDSCDSGAESETRMVDPQTGRPSYVCRSCALWLDRCGFARVPVGVLPGAQGSRVPLAVLLAAHTGRAS